MKFSRHISKGWICFDTSVILVVKKYRGEKLTGKGAPANCSLLFENQLKTSTFCIEQLPWHWPYRIQVCNLLSTFWKVLEKFTDGIILSICPVHSSVESVHQQTLEANNIGKKLNETQLVFLYLLKRKKHEKINLKRRLPSVFHEQVPPEIQAQKGSNYKERFFSFVAQNLNPLQQYVNVTCLRKASNTLNFPPPPERTSLWKELLSSSTVIWCLYFQRARDMGLTPWDKSSICSSNS